MVEFMDMLARGRRFFIAGIFVLVDVLLISLLVSTARSHPVQASRQTHGMQNASYNTASYDSPNVITNAFFALADNVAQEANGFNARMARTLASAVAGSAHSGKVAAHEVRSSASTVVKGVGNGFVFVGHDIGSGLAVAGHGVRGSFKATGNGVSGGFGSAGHDLLAVSLLPDRVAAGAFGFATHATHISSVIRPKDTTPTPIITQMRMQQAAIIQSGTKIVQLASIVNGVGGACDAGDGNGGYPMKWCNVPIDSASTIPYSGDAINRECTSYAYWYFTHIEGHTGFWATGNAKYWAATSNYPTHLSPAVGGIAVETAGAYGHVAIVQALSGQKYAGERVPAGYLLVSEMNYDWGGHFRYSLSPLSKFSAYIYP